MQDKAAVWTGAKRFSFCAGPNAALLTAPNAPMFIADADYEIVSAAETHETLGTDGSAVTADVVKAADGTTIANGTSMLASTKFNLKATINTEQRKTLSNGGLASSLTDRILYKGQRLGVKFSGTMTAVTGVCLTVVLLPLRRANW